MNPLRPICLAVLACTLGMLAAPVSAQALRERLRERIEQRRSERAAPEAPASGRSVTSKGALQEFSVTFRGQSRNVLVYVPSAHQGVASLPLVVALHGGGGHAAYMSDDERYGLSRMAESAGFLVAYPNGYSKLPGGKFATWNAGGCCGDARDRNIDDVGFLREVVATVKARFHVDARRVFAIGMSNGGMMSYRLACEASDVFRAVGSVAGTDAVPDCHPTQPVAVLHIHAKNDDHVLFDGGAGQGAFRDPSKVMTFPSVPETVSRWVRRGQCSPTPKRVLQVAGAYCERYDGCAGHSAVQLCVTQDGGHSWPGADKTRHGKASPSQALSANDVLWDFFSHLDPR